MKRALRPCSTPCETFCRILSSSLPRSREAPDPKDFRNDAEPFQGLGTPSSKPPETLNPKYSKACTPAPQEVQRSEVPCRGMLGVEGFGGFKVLEL